MVLVALNEEKAYVFESAKFLTEIEAVYAGAVSKNNGSFSASVTAQNIDYSNPSSPVELLRIIQGEGFIKVQLVWLCVFY